RDAAPLASTMIKLAKSASSDVLAILRHLGLAVRDHDVVPAATAVDLVLAVPIPDEIVARAAACEVVAVLALDHVVAREAPGHVGEPRPGERVPSSRADDRRRATAASGWFHLESLRVAE